MYTLSDMFILFIDSPCKCVFFSAGCCVTSDTFVVRDKDYNGSATKERASLVLRIAPTFLRYNSKNLF